MLTYQQARQLADQEVSRMNDMGIVGDLTIVGSSTLEKSYARIFFYDSKRHIETGDIVYTVAGNTPPFISKFDGHISFFPTGLSIDQMIMEYEEKHQIWELVLIDNIYTDLRKLLDLKKSLNLSNTEIAAYKRSSRAILETGSEKRLLELKRLLAEKNDHVETS